MLIDFEKIVQDCISSLPEGHRNLPLDPIAKQIEQALLLYRPGSIHYDSLINLLSLSLNKLKLSSVHISFVSILNQISEDEILLIKKVGESSIEFVAKYDYDEIHRHFFNYQYLDHPHPEKGLQFPECFDLYITNLRRLKIINFNIYNQVPIIQNNSQTGITEYSRIEFTNLGYIFFQAIIPQKHEN